MDGEPPELLVFSFGRGPVPSGKSVCDELARLTPTTVHHLPSDDPAAAGDDGLWERLEILARSSELPCICIYDAQTCGPVCGPGGGDEARLEPAWGRRVAALLAAADEVHEVIFVFDRGRDGHPGPGERPARWMDVADGLSGLPVGLEEYLLPTMRARCVRRPRQRRAVVVAKHWEAIERRHLPPRASCCCPGDALAPPPPAPPARAPAATQPAPRGGGWGGGGTNEDIGM